jgi:uncharacterized protein YigE (DUF2233 family)
LKRLFIYVVLLLSAIGSLIELGGCHTTQSSLKKQQDTTTTAEYVIKSPVTKRIVKYTNLISNVISDTLFQVGAGVKETDIYYKTQKYRPMHVFILQVDLTKPGVKLEAGLSYDGSNFTRKTVLDMAKGADSTGHRVAAGINADYFSFSSNKPVGIVAENDEILKKSWSHNWTFLGIQSDGKAYIGYEKDFLSKNKQLKFKEALGAGQMLILNGKVQPETNHTKAPRTGAGITGDGIVYFIVADGRASGYSSGMTLKQEAIMLKACGAVKAINFDGGGSSTFLIRNNEKWVVRNKPSDGSLRSVTDSWLVISKK